MFRLVSVGRFQHEGPAGQVIGEISAKADPADLPQVVEAAETLGLDLIFKHVCVMGSSGISWHFKQCQAMSWAQTEASSKFTYARELLVKIHRPLT